MPSIATQDASEPEVRVVRDTSEWDRLRGPWEALCDASPTASSPLRFDWLRNWWAIYGPVYERPGGGLTVYTFWRGPRLVGALPLYAGLDGGRVLGRRWLRFVSTGEAEFEETLPCYLDLLHLPGEDDACLRALVHALTSRSVQPWDSLELIAIDEQSPLAGLAPRFGGNYRAGSEPLGVCPVADLAGGFEAYLSRLSHKTRQHARQYLRAAERQGGVLEVARSADDAETYFQDLVRLHQGRWVAAGKQGCFASPRFTEFHRTLARAGVPNGKALLARLNLGGRLVAVIYGFLEGNEFEFYQSGVLLDEESVAAASPGTTVILMLMRHLAAAGVTAFDFLGGGTTYKQRLATFERRISTLRVVRPGLRVAAHAASGMVRRASRKGIELCSAAARAGAANAGAKKEQN